MKAIRVTAAALSLLAALSSARWETAAEDVSGSILRLHVQAASDSAEDQRKKLAARDAVLAVVEPILEECPDRAEAKRRVEAALPELARAAAAASGQEAEAFLVREAFPERDYGAFALPAGEYEALRVRLNGGAGHNWWCVVFPPLCAALETGREQGLALFDEAEERLIFGGGRRVKFRFLEWIQSFLKKAGA